MTDAGNERATARFEDKREAILDAAARLFNAQGIRGGMLADVARSVSLATNSLTYYYRKKEALACACLLRSMDALGATADAACAEATLERRVAAFFERYFALLAAIADGRHPELIVFSDVLALSPPHDAAMAEAYNRMFRRVRHLLDVPGAPQLDAAPRNARAHLLLSLVSWARTWLARYESADYARAAAIVADVLLHGIAERGRVPTVAAIEIPPSAAGDAEPTRAAYLRAATRLVNDHSYRGASVDRIAAELKLTKGSFYHHHETKEELIAACFERTFGVVRAAQTSALAAPGSGLDRLAAACRALLDFQMSAQGPLLRVTAWTGLPEPIRAETRRTMARLGERFAAFVIDGMADGSLRIVDPSIAAQMINGMLNAAAELERWVGGVDAGNAFELFALPLFCGLQNAPPTPAARVPQRGARERTPSTT